MAGAGPAAFRFRSTEIDNIADSTAQKLPAIAGDLLAGFLLWRYARRRGDEREWVLPAIYLLNPVTVILSKKGWVRGRTGHGSACARWHRQHWY